MASNLSPTRDGHPLKLWEPASQLLNSSHMTRFNQFVARKRGLKNLLDGGYAALYDYSVTRISDFWVDVLEYTQVRYSTPANGPAVDESAPMDAFPDWFPGMRLNFAENLLVCRDPDRVALIETTELLQLKYVTYAELFERVRIMAAALKKMGVGIGDRVGGYICNCNEAIIAMLAASSLGAIWCSASPDFGVTGVLDRFSQIKPKILFSVNAVFYNGRAHDHIAKLKSVADGLRGSVERIVVATYIEDHPADLSEIPEAVTLQDFLATGDPNYELTFEQLPFKHPQYILFSSGTTGKPKCIVHSAGGTLLQHKKEHMIHGNLGPGDVFMQYTTTGWMMWNWLVSGLSVGATLVIYDGSPFKPRNDVLWELVEKAKITAFGTSAKYIQSLQELKVNVRKYDVSSLHSIYSTGSPLKPESFSFVYEEIKKDLVLGSITGGTDIISLFAGHNTNLPVYRGELQCICLGMKVEAWAGENKPVYGEAGDLVCSKVFPCMPVYFWDDANAKRYKSAYFEHYPHVWSHGDFVLINPNTGGMVILGRSDGTLNPAGVRFGSAELYNIIDGFPQVADSLVVGQKQGNDERVCMFLQMAGEQKLTSDLINEIKARIRGQLSPRHVPAIIVQVPDIPYTINGKKVEVAVKQLISGATVVSSGTLRNPEALDYYATIPELKA